MKEDISRLIEEGRLEFKLNELDRLESAAKNNPEAAWSVNSIKNYSPSSIFFFLSSEMFYWLRQVINA